MDTTQPITQPTTKKETRNSSTSPKSHKLQLLQLTTRDGAHRTVLYVQRADGHTFPPEDQTAYWGEIRAKKLAAFLNWPLEVIQSTLSCADQAARKV